MDNLSLFEKIGIMIIKIMVVLFIIRGIETYIRPGASGVIIILGIIAYAAYIQLDITYQLRKRLRDENNKD